MQQLYIAEQCTFIYRKYSASTFQIGTARCLTLLVCHDTHNMYILKIYMLHLLRRPHNSRTIYYSMKKRPVDSSPRTTTFCFCEKVTIGFNYLFVFGMVCIVVVW